MHKPWIIAIGVALCVVSAPAPAAVFEIPPDDSDALALAFAESGSNGEPDIIELANDGAYRVDRVAAPLRGRLIVNGNGATIYGDDVRPFDTRDDHYLTIEPGAEVTLKDLEFRSLDLFNLIHNRGSVDLLRVSISESVAGDCYPGTPLGRPFCDGELLWNQGRMSLSSTTFHRNFGVVGVLVRNEGELTLSHVTVADNFLAALDNVGTGRIVNSIIGLCHGAPLESLGHNIDEDGRCGLDRPSDMTGVDPRLGDFADHGGSVPTVALSADSPAPRTRVTARTSMLADSSGRSGLGRAATSAPSSSKPGRRRFGPRTRRHGTSGAVTVTSSPFRLWATAGTRCWCTGTATTRRVSPCGSRAWAKLTASAAK